jgi:hypothetical protein
MNGPGWLLANNTMLVHQVEFRFRLTQGKKKNAPIKASKAKKYHLTQGDGPL